MKYLSTLYGSITNNPSISYTALNFILDEFEILYFKLSKHEIAHNDILLPETINNMHLITSPRHCINRVIVSEHWCRPPLWRVFIDYILRNSDDYLSHAYFNLIGYFSDIYFGPTIALNISEKELHDKEKNCKNNIN